VHYVQRRPIVENSDDNTRVFSSKVNDGAHVAEGVFSSKANNEVDGTESSDSPPKSVEKNFFGMRNEAHANVTVHPEQRELQMADSFTFLNEHDPANNIMDLASFDDFLEHIDLQLKSLEYETEQFMSSKLIEEVDNDILELIKETRER
jgi:hypothetical protein